jgi:trans-aconitate methyltransferase
MMNDQQIELWLEDGYTIRSRYQQKLRADGLHSAKSLGERTHEKDFQFLSQLFQGISLSGSISVLDIGCGKAALIPFLQNNYPDVNIDRYLGLDLVEEFLDIARHHYPVYEFQLQNFISDKFVPPQRFEIVIALGVLVSRVRYYPEFVESFIQKMLRYGSGYLLFNVIGEMDRSSYNYLAHEQVGHSMMLSRSSLEAILDSVGNLSYSITESRIFPDATDLFVQICDL